MRIIAITQARVGSSRLPAKVLKKLGPTTLLQLHLSRAARAGKIDQLVVATTIEPDASGISDIARGMQIPVYHGSIDDVLDRYYQVASQFEADYIVRITSDCPLIDPKLIDAVIDFALDKEVDYVSNTLNPTFPDGEDIEVFRFTALKKAWEEAELKSEREHVSSYIWKNSSFLGKSLFRSASFENAVDYSSVRLTVDEQSDLDTISTIVGSLGVNASWEEYARYYQDNITNMSNSLIKRNEGYYKSISNDK